MFPFAESVVALWLTCCARPAGAVAVDPLDETFRSFVVEKQAQSRNDLPAAAPQSALSLLIAPDARDVLRSTVGLGYVEGADWASELRADGMAFGWETQVDALVTYGALGARLDYGAVSFRDPERHWWGEAGDMFSDLRGPVRGLRVSRPGQRWAPGIAVYVDRGAFQQDQPRLVYRDRLRLGLVRLDGEVATDGGQFYRSRLTSSRVDLEGAWRDLGAAAVGRDQAAHAGIRVWRDVWVSGSWQRSVRDLNRSEWRSLAVRVPLGRSFAVTLERTLLQSNASADVVWATGVAGRQGPIAFYQRYQWGRAEMLDAGLFSSFDRQQLQAMAAYTPGPRLNVTLQSATQWAPSGGPQHWLEMEATLRPGRRTLLQVASPMPQTFDTSRLRLRLEQGLPGRFLISAEYGRLASFQGVQDARERPRAKVMLFRTWDLATPARGGDVSGQVLDYLNRPVPGALVRLGPYTAESDALGEYRFARVPAGEFDLSLDADFVPADYAWDGRARRVRVRASGRQTIDLFVAPLNAVHGRVYADRNGNGRFDAGEGVVNAVVFLGERATSTDVHGAYDFFNVPLGAQTLRLEGAKLPSSFAAGANTELHVELTDSRPVTGADFVVVARTKPIVWKEMK